MKIKIDKTLLIPLFFSLLMLQGAQVVAEQPSISRTDKGDKLSAIAIPTELHLMLNGPRGPTEVRLRKDGTIKATIDRDKPTIRKPSKEQWDRFSKAIMAAGVGNWGENYDNHTIADKAGWGVTITIPRKLALASYGNADAWPNADGTSSKSETKSFQLFEQAVRDLVKSSLVEPGTETGGPEIAKGTDITGIPDSFEFSSSSFLGTRKVTFNKKTHQMTDTVTDSKTGRTISQIINIPPEKWAPFLQAVNAAGGKSLNGQEIIDPNPPVINGGWDMKINDTKFSVLWSTDRSINNIYGILRDWVGVEPWSVFNNRPFVD